MANSPDKRETWLVAVWPGMGNIAVGAGAYLVAKLGANLIHEIPARDTFDLQSIEVKDGLARAGRLPRSMFFEWRNPRTPGPDGPVVRDLLLFLGEAQPAARGLAFCHRLLDFAASRGVTRVFSFAAMATQLHPSDAPRVFGVATERPLIDELKALEVSILKEGQISGLNGVLMAAAAERAIPGICLLGELPYFAAAVPNPRASHAVLQVFTTMAGIEVVDFTDLKAQADTVEKALLELLEKMKEAARQQQEGEEGFTVPEFAKSQDDEEEPDVPPTEKAAKPAIDPATSQRIETLFEAAHKDRAKAFQLKEELDRLGVFKQYEDRFLDLFKRAE